MPVLGRAQILEARDLKQERVDVPEWGGEVIVQELGAAAASKFMAMSMSAVDIETRKIRDAREMFDLYVWVAAHAIVDEEGVLVFSGDEGVAALSKKNLAPVRRIAEVALNLSGLKRQAAEDAKKKSSTTLNGASGSD